MNKKYYLFLVAFVFSGCTQTSGVLPMGLDTYTITTSNELQGVPGAKKQAISEANKHCVGLEKQMLPVNASSSVQPDFMGDPIGHYEITFRCLNEDDPEFKRPNLEYVSD